METFSVLLAPFEGNSPVNKNSDNQQEIETEFRYGICRNNASGT